MHPRIWTTQFPFNDGWRTPEADYEEIVADDFAMNPISIVDLEKALGVSRTRVNQLLNSGVITAVWRGNGDASKFIFGDIEKARSEHYHKKQPGLKKRAKAGGDGKARVAKMKTDPSSGSTE